MFQVLTIVPLHIKVENEGKAQNDVSLQLQESSLWFQIPGKNPSSLYRRTKEDDFE